MNRILLLFAFTILSPLSNQKVSCSNEMNNDLMSNISENIMRLSDSSFDEYINGNGNVLVLFYDYSEISKQIVNNLDHVANELMNKKSNGKIAVMNSVLNKKTTDNYIAGKLPKILLFNGSTSDYIEYPNHLTGKEKYPMVAIMLSRDSPLYQHFDASSYNKIQEAVKLFDLEDKIHSSSLPVLVYFGKKDTKRTNVMIESLKFIREKGVSVKAYFIYVKYKSDIGLYIHRLPDPDKYGVIQTNPKEMYKADMKILGVFEWTRDIISIFIESSIRPYVSFRGNEPMYVDKTSNSLITYLKGENTEDIYGNSMIKFLDDIKMDKLKRIARENFHPEDPDKDLAVGLILPGLEGLVESNTGFYRKDHVDNGSYLLKKRNTKFDLEDSGETDKYVIPEDVIMNCKDNFEDVFSDVEKRKYPIFYRSKILKNTSNFFLTIEDYHKKQPRGKPLEMNMNTLREYVYSDKYENTAFLLLFYAELSSESVKAINLFKRLAEDFPSKFEGKDKTLNVIVSLFDVEGNDLPSEFKVKKIPLIYYIPFGSNKVSNSVMYTDSLTLSATKGYLKDRVASQGILFEEDDERTDKAKDKGTDNYQKQVKDEL